MYNKLYMYIQNQTLISAIEVLIPGTVKTFPANSLKSQMREHTEKQMDLFHSVKKNKN